MAQKLTVAWETYSNLRLAAARLKKLQKIVLGLFVGVLVISG